MNSTPVEAHSGALQRLRSSLASEQSTALLITRWRAESALLAALPSRYGEVLESLLTRFESASAFGEESCSFSVKDLLGQLTVWLEKAERQLAR